MTEQAEKNTLQSEEKRVLAKASTPNAIEKQAQAKAGALQNTQKCEPAPKPILRPAPCPDYDIEGLESWLMDLARQGLLLQKNGIHFGLFRFTRGTPQALTYRLEAAEHAKSIFTEEQNEPDADKQALYSRLGWDYLARYQNFYIFASTDTAPRELNTDPTLQALTLGMIKKRQITATIWPTVQFLLIVAISLYEDGLLRMTLAVGSSLALLWLVSFLFWLYTMVREIVHLSKLRKTLHETGILNHRKNWQVQQKANFTRAGIAWGLILLSFCGLCFRWQQLNNDADRISLTEYTQDPPFATLTDMMDEDATYTYTVKNWVNNANTVVTWQDPLAPENIEWIEAATITQDDTFATAPSYSVTYHQLATPWLAKQLAQEYSNQIANGFSRDETPALTSTPDADYFAIYDVYVGVSFIIQQGDKVACVTFYDPMVDNDDAPTAPFTLEECIATVAESLG